MNLVKQIVAQTSDGYTHSADMRDRDTMIASMEASHAELAAIQRANMQVATVVAALEDLEEAGMANRSTAIMAMAGMEALGYSIDLAGLESLDEAEFLTASTEGLMDVVRKVGNRFKEWFENSKADQLSLQGRTGELAHNLRETIKNVHERLDKHDDSTRVTVSLKKIGHILTIGAKNKFDVNRLVSYLDNAPKVDGYFVAGGRLAESLRSAYGTLDVSSDAAFEKTYLKNTAKFFGQWLKKPVLEETGISLTWNIKPWSAADVKAWSEGAILKTQGALYYDMGKRATASKEATLSVADARKLLGSAEKLCDFLEDTQRSRRWGTTYDSFYHALLNMYLVEIGSPREKVVRLAPNLSKVRLKVGLLQQIGAPGFGYMDQGGYAGLYDAALTAKAAVQLARRVAIEGKVEKD